MDVRVAIKSCHRHTARRQAQLDTWLSELQCDWFWLIGSPTPSEDGPVITDSLACRVSDAFEDIAPKVWTACFYALENGVDGLYIMDDDTYACPERLTERHADYAGFMRTSGLDYNKNIPYAQGSCFYVSARAMEFIVKAKDIMRPGVIDDGAVGQALYGHVPFVHDDRYEPGPNPGRRPLKSNNVISTHKCHLPEIMHRVHNDWRGNA